MKVLFVYRLYPGENLTRERPPFYSKELARKRDVQIHRRHSASGVP
jgi:hypothetical protein